MCDAERRIEDPLCDPDQGPSKEGVMNSSIAGDTGYPSVKVMAKFVVLYNVITIVGFHYMP